MKIISSLVITIMILLADGFYACGLYAQPVNYSLLQNWMCHPMKSHDVSQMPMNVFVIDPALSIDTVIQYPQPSANTGVDIFYVYPTLNLSLIPYNTPISAIDTTYAKYAFRMQAGLTSQFGRVFVPYYRQASFGTFLLAGGVNQANILDSAYHDIEAAFNHYMINYNNGNKIILIGHSQGGYMVQALLRQYFDNNPAMMAKLVVAIPGGNFYYVNQGMRKGGGLENIEVCPPLKSGYGCGCVIPWKSFKYNSVLPPPNSALPYMNSNFVTNNFFYSVFDPIQHEVQYFDFGYKQANALTRYIALNPIDSIDYIGFENMYSAYYEEQTVGKAGLMINNIQRPDDLRTSPMSGTDYHVYDFQIVQGDLLIIIQDMINNCLLPSEVSYPNSIKIKTYPNPFSTHTTLQTDNSLNNAILTVFNMQGIAVKQINNINGHSVILYRENLPSGIYFFQLTQHKTVLTTSKLVIIDN